MASSPVHAKDPGCPWGSRGKGKSQEESGWPLVCAKVFAQDEDGLKLGSAKPWQASWGEGWAALGCARATLPSWVGGCSQLPFGCFTSRDTFYKMNSCPEAAVGHVFPPSSVAGHSLKAVPAPFPGNWLGGHRFNRILSSCCWQPTVPPIPSHHEGLLGRTSLGGLAETFTQGGPSSRTTACFVLTYPRGSGLLLAL